MTPLICASWYTNKGPRASRFEPPAARVWLQGPRPPAAPPPPPRPRVKHVFVRRAQEALSVARVRGNGYVWKQGLQAMAYGGGRCYQTGLDRPTEEVG